MRDVNKLIATTTKREVISDIIKKINVDQDLSKKINVNAKQDPS